MPIPSEPGLAAARSALYEALAIGLRPPTPDTFSRLGGGGQARALAELAAVVEGGPGSTGLADHVHRLVETLAEVDLGALESSHRQIFGHTARPKVPPYETEYGDGAWWQQPHELSDILGIYRAFGLRISGHPAERADHVSCECEFLSFLARKEAYALEAGDGPMAEETGKAQRIFLGDHLGKFAPAFARELSQADPSGFYGSLGRLLGDFVLDECLRFGVPAGPDHLRLRSTQLMEECDRCE